jgi:hypothetical protein
MIDISQSRITGLTSGRYAQTFIEFPPMQKGATFNAKAVMQRIEAARGT